MTDDPKIIIFSQTQELNIFNWWKNIKNNAIIIPETPS